MNLSRLGDALVMRYSELDDVAASREAMEVCRKAVGGDPTCAYHERLAEVLLYAGQRTGQEAKLASSVDALRMGDQDRRFRLTSDRPRQAGCGLGRAGQAWFPVTRTERLTAAADTFREAARLTDDPPPWVFFARRGQRGLNRARSGARPVEVTLNDRPRWY